MSASPWTAKLTGICVVCEKSMCSELVKSTEFVLVIKRVLVGFVRVTFALHSFV